MERIQSGAGKQGKATPATEKGNWETNKLLVEAAA